jgi:hypothetical protein
VRVVENLRPVASPDKEQSTEGHHSPYPFRDVTPGPNAENRIGSHRVRTQENRIGSHRVRLPTGISEPPGAPAPSTPTLPTPIALSR